MSGPTTQRFACPDLPHPGRAAQLVLLSSATAPAPAIATPPTDTSHPTGAGPMSTQLRLSPHSCFAPAAGHPLQPQDRLSPSQTPSLASLAPPAYLAARPTPRGQGGRAPIQPPLGLRHHHLQALVGAQAPAGSYHRLCRPHGHRLEITASPHRLGHRRTPPRSPLSTLWPSVAIRQRAGVPHRQWPGVHRGATPALAGPFRFGRLPYSLSQPAIQRPRRVLLWQSQKRLPGTSALGDFAPSLEAHPHLDHPLQRSRTPQRPQHVRPNHFRSTMVDTSPNKNYLTTCPVQAGSHQKSKGDVSCWLLKRQSLLAEGHFDALHFGGFGRLALLLRLGRLDSHGGRRPGHDVMDV